VTGIVISFKLHETIRAEKKLIANATIVCLLHGELYTSARFLKVIGSSGSLDGTVKLLFDRRIAGIYLSFHPVNEPGAQ